VFVTVIPSLYEKAQICHWASHRQYYFYYAFFNLWHLSLWAKENITVQNGIPFTNETKCSLYPLFTIWVFCKGGEWHEHNNRAWSIINPPA
jgi:hypothetical protein